MIRMQKLTFLLLAAVLLLPLSLPAMAETVEPYGEPWLTSIVDGMYIAPEDRIAIWGTNE